MPRHLLCMALVAGALAACGQGDDPSPEPAAAAPRSGSEVFAATCAMCHGADGDGNGTVKLDRPARDFRAGGFSFGNTRQALFRTVSGGIGGTPMPGFAEALSEEERWAVVDHVISLLPEPPVEAGEAAVLAVGDRPQVVRGQFRPLAEGLPAHARGLMVGGTDGLSWQYRADDLRLLAVRQGAFVRRADWGERGGMPLEVLGKPVHLLGGGDPAAPFTTGDGAALRARLRGTRIEDGRAWVSCSLHDAAGAELATLRETGSAASTSQAAGYRRVLEIEASAPLRVRLLDGSGHSSTTRQDRLWLSSGDPARPLLLGVTGAGDGSVQHDEDAVHLELPAGRHELVLTTILPSTWDDTTREALIAELEG